MDAAAPPPLSGVPLHALAVERGEAGLRAELTAQVSGMTAEPLARALALATRLHRVDRWGTQPYLNHLLRVALRIRCDYQIRDPDVLCAALLHDAVEDHSWQLSRAMELATDDGWAVPDPPAGPAGDPVAATATALDRLAVWFGPRVADLVEAVTNPPWDGGRDRHQQYRDHLRTSLWASPWARVIKIADFTDNAGGLTLPVDPRTRRTAEKYRSVAPLLRELLELPDTPLPDEVKQHIRRQFTQIDERLRILLAPPA